MQISAILKSDLDPAQSEDFIDLYCFCFRCFDWIWSVLQLEVGCTCHLVDQPTRFSIYDRIHGTGICTTMFSWFCMENVGKYTIHSSYGIYKKLPNKVISLPNRSKLPSNVAIASSHSEMSKNFPGLTNKTIMFSGGWSFQVTDW